MNKISKTFLITDTHIGHVSKMHEFCNRPFDFEKKIIKRWKNTVRQQDIVYHLGDVTWGSQKQLSSILKSLPGIKFLIRGNHDKNHSDNWFMNAGFTAVFEKIQVKKVILSHTPAIMTQEELDFNIINVHGHFHNNPVEKWEKHMTDRITPNHYLLSIENVNYFPVPLKDVIRKKYVESSFNLLEKYKNKG